jgi:hypothetical protein
MPKQVKPPRKSFWRGLFRGPIPEEEKYGATNSDGHTILDTEKLKRSPKFQKLQKEVEELDQRPKRI